MRCEPKNTSEKNREIIKRFLDNCAAERLSEVRIKKYDLLLRQIAGMLNKDFDAVSEADVKTLVANLQRSDYAEWTKRDYLVAIKKFYKWFEGNNEEYPKKVRWIKATIKNHKKKLPQELLSEADVLKLIEASKHIETKALIAILWETGARIAEVLGMKRKHIVLDEDMAHVVVSGKTGDRRIPILTSVPYMVNWLNNHHDKSPDAPVWICRENANRKGKIGYAAVRKMLTLTAVSCGLSKKVNPHMFRHSRASFLANKLTESQLKAFFGWVQASDMAAVYVHLSGRDIDNAILTIHGKRKPEENEDSKLMPKTCAVCGEAGNEATSKFCRRCGRPLDTQTAMDMKTAKGYFARSIMREEIRRAIKEEMKTLMRAELRGVSARP